MIVTLLSHDQFQSWEPMRHLPRCFCLFLRRQNPFPASSQNFPSSLTGLTANPEARTFPELTASLPEQTGVLSPGKCWGLCGGWTAIAWATFSYKETEKVNKTEVQVCCMCFLYKTLSVLGDSGFVSPQLGCDDSVVWSRMTMVGGLSVSLLCV